MEKGDIQGMSGFYNPENWKRPIVGVDLAKAGSKDLSAVAIYAEKQTLVNLANAMITGAAAILALNGPEDLIKKAALLNDTGERLLRDIMGG